MKTLVKKIWVEQEIIEAREVETIIYKCDLCEFEDEDDEEVTNHYNKTHTIKEEKNIGNDKFVRFNTKEDMRGLAKASITDYSCYDDYEINWRGPIWYKVYNEWRRCSRNCCDKCIMLFKPIDQVIDDLEDSIAVDQNKLDLIRTSFNIKKGKENEK